MSGDLAGRSGFSRDVCSFVTGFLWFLFWVDAAWNRVLWSVRWRGQKPGEWVSGCGESKVSPASLKVRIVCALEACCLVVRHRFSSRRWGIRGDGIRYWARSVG